MGGRTVAGFGCRQLVSAMVALLVVLLGEGVEPARGVSDSTGLCETLVQPWGYPCTEYTVETDDGFLLGVQNIPQGVSQLSTGAPRTPVFLQHGLFAGGDNWLFNGPEESLAFILADAGFDVWIGNIRGIDWSHGHVTLTTDDPEFWDWSWDELAAYDLPAMLQFVYNQTGSQMLYVGHSQGTSTFMAGLVGTNMSEAMTNMLSGAALLCPIAYMDGVTSLFVDVAADLYLDKIINLFGAHEFTLHNDLGQELIQDVCGTAGVNCTDLFKAVNGNDCCMNWTRVDFYLNFFPQPSSSKNLAHFAQMVRKNTFSMYDYGMAGNLLNYYQATPPSYNVANLPDSVPIMLVSGGHDQLADPANVQYLTSLLGSQVKKTLILENYSHADFVASQSANVDVYEQVIQFLKNPSGSS